MNAYSAKHAEEASRLQHFADQLVKARAPLAERSEVELKLAAMHNNELQQMLRETDIVALAMMLLQCSGDTVKRVLVALSERARLSLLAAIEKKHKTAAN